MEPHAPDAVDFEVHDLAVLQRAQALVVRAAGDDVARVERHDRGGELDEIADPNDVHVRFWVDGQLRHNYNTDDMEHPVPELVEFATAIMTLNTGDLIACGTNHEGLGPLQDGEVVDFEIQDIGRMRLSVRDPLKRTWEKGIYMGADSTNPEAIKRNRPSAR